MTLLSEMPPADQAAVIDLVALAIEKRRLLHFGELVDKRLDLASAVLRRLRDYGAAWTMDGDHLRVVGWVRERE